MCQAGYIEPVITEETQTSTQNLDCRPIVEPLCPAGQFVDVDNKCVPQSACETEDYCNGAGGVYDADLDNCFCDNQENNPEYYCDAQCQFEALRVYQTKDDKIELTSAGVSRVFDLSEFGESFLLAEGSCPIVRCQIMSQKLVGGKMVASEEASQDFVDFWRQNVNPEYESPYPGEALRRQRFLEAYYFPQYVNNLYVNPLAKSDDVDTSFMNMLEKGEYVQGWDSTQLNKQYSLSTAYNGVTYFQIDGDSIVAPVDDTVPVEETVPESVVEEEELGLVEPGSETFDGAANFIERTIQCIEPFDAVSFEVTPVNFPVYIKESKFNTNDDYDYGPFVVLETKLHNAKLAISSFVVNFAYEGTYVFGDFQTPETPQTIVFVTSEKNEVCLG